MAKITKQQLELFNTAYESYKRIMNLEFDAWKDEQIAVLKQADLKTFKEDQDYIDFGIQSFLHNMKNKHDELLLMLNNVKEARDIGKGKY